jgi:hypothetical protein
VSRRLPLDPEYGVRVPFACTADYAHGGGGSVRRLDHRRVPQCALSRVCGLCGESLGRPVAFVGTRLEADRNAFHFPPLHVACAETMLTAYADLPAGALGIGDPREPDADGTPHEPWTVVTTSGFEYVRPTTEQADRRPVFEPNSLLG